MLKKSITFEDLDGRQVTDIFHFHLNKAEIAELEVDAEGGSFIEMFQKILEDNDKSQIMKTFKVVIRKAYGIRGADGRQFKKSEEISDEFMQSDAYSELFYELMSKPEASAEFITAVIPTLPNQDNLPTPAELSKMSVEELQALQEGLQKARSIEKLQGHLQKTQPLADIVGVAPLDAAPTRPVEVIPFPELTQRPHKLPEYRGDFVLESGPFKGLSQDQVDVLQQTGLLAEYISHPERFEK